MRRVLMVGVALLVGACKQGGGGAGRAAPAPGSAAPGSAAVAKAPPPPAASATIVPLLYEVRRDDRRNHVLGTVDIGVEVARLPPPVWDAFAAAKTVVLEWNFGERTAGLRDKMVRPAGTKLSDTLTADERVALAGAMGPDASALETSATWMATAVISATGIARTDAIQAVLADRAQSQEQPITYLESMDVQVTRTAAWLDERALKALLADVPALRRGNDAYLAAFARGDEAELRRLRAERTPWKTAGRTGAELARLDADTLINRHAAWLPTLTPLLDAGRAFVAVDAAHLVGDDGLLARLRTAGYVVTRVGG